MPVVEIVDCAPTVVVTRVVELTSIQDVRMSEARCTLQVRGLDCPKEVDSITAAIKDQAGVMRLGFDLIHGTMTIDFDDSFIDPQTIIRLIRERAGLQSSLQGPVEPAAESWWSRYGRWVFTAGSGAALAGGTVMSWTGHRLGSGQTGVDRLAVVGYALAVLIGGIGIFPRAARNLVRLRFDIDVLMGLAILGAMALGQWDEAATVAFLYGLSEALEGLSLDYARRSIRALLELAPPTAERIGADGTTQVVPASQIRRGDRVLVRTGDHDSRRWHSGFGTVERRSKDDHRRVGAGASRRGRSGLRGDDQWRRDAGSHGLGSGRRRRDLSGHRPGPREPGRPRADRAADLAVRGHLYAARHRPVTPGHARPSALRLGHWNRQCRRHGPMARVVWARACGPGHRLSVRLGDRDACGHRLWACGRGTREAC